MQFTLEKFNLHLHSDLVHGTVWHVAQGVGVARGVAMVHDVAKGRDAGVCAAKPWQGVTLAQVGGVAELWRGVAEQPVLVGVAKPLQGAVVVWVGVLGLLWRGVAIPAHDMGLDWDDGTEQEKGDRAEIQYRSQQ